MVHGSPKSKSQIRHFHSLSGFSGPLEKLDNFFVKLIFESSTFFELLEEERKRGSGFLIYIGLSSVCNLNHT